MKAEDLTSLRQRLLDTRHALMERIAQQRGGAVGRLQASPEAERCVACQTQQEHQRPH